MNRLFVNALKSVGLVGAGDDPEAQVTFWKSKDSEMRTTDPDVTKVLTSAESAPGQGDSMPELDLSAIESEDIRKAVETAIAAKDAEIEDLKAQLEPDESPVDKADPEVQAILKAQQEEVAKLREELADEQKTRRVEKFTAKAAPMETLLGKAEEMGPVLEALEAADPDAYNKLESALVAASQREELAHLFKTLGHEGESEADPISARDSWVAKNRNEGETEYDARARFWKAHPEMRS